ncbi:MBL fold metallo-hydrolase [bacterium]|nr:MBL fold metallo-hydrolase [bacterium]
MRLFHLNCGTWCPATQPLINGTGTMSRPGEVVCHCLLVETGDGLVLIDTGLGTADLANPRQRIGGLWTALMRPQTDLGESALRQIERLGFKADDVRDIVVTHLDFDHAGGIPDFPKAQVHVYAPEYEAAMARRSLRERFRYKPDDWGHRPQWLRYETEGDRWYGFDSVRALSDRSSEILLVPLLGHTRGHCGVAVDSDQGWLLLAGDIYFHHDELEPNGHSPIGLQIYENVMHMDRSVRQENVRRLQALHRDHGADVQIFSSHDPEEFYRFVPQTQAAERR